MSNTSLSAFILELQKTGQKGEPRSIIIGDVQFSCIISADGDISVTPMRYENGKWDEVAVNVPLTWAQHLDPKATVFQHSLYSELRITA